MKLLLNRFRITRGAVVGRLSQEIVDDREGVIDREHICDTVEREGSNLPPGEYLVVIAKSVQFHRKMLYLKPSYGSARSSSFCGMMQPGNGPFTLHNGSILIGEARPPGFVVNSQSLFLQLFNRIKKAMRRGGEVKVEVV